jgi:hypothetical protein
MHKKPEIAFVMPDSVTAGEKFQIQINFDGAKMDRAEVFVIAVPTAGYKDPETGVVITEKDAKTKIEDVEKKNKNKVYKKKDSKEDQKKEKEAAGGEDKIMKIFKLSKKMSSQFLDSMLDLFVNALLVRVTQLM